jgi:hypothetical protein
MRLGFPTVCYARKPNVCWRVCDSGSAWRTKEFGPPAQCEGADVRSCLRQSEFALLPPDFEIHTLALLHKRRYLGTSSISNHVLVMCLMCWRYMYASEITHSSNGEDSLYESTSRACSSDRSTMWSRYKKTSKSMNATLTIHSIPHSTEPYHPHKKSVASVPKAPNILTPSPATTTRHHVTPAASQPAIEIPSEIACFHPYRTCDLARD